MPVNTDVEHVSSPARAGSGGCADEQFTNPRAARVTPASLVTLALNVADPLVAGEFGWASALNESSDKIDGCGTADLGWPCPDGSPCGAGKITPSGGSWYAFHGDEYVPGARGADIGHVVSAPVTDLVAESARAEREQQIDDTGVGRVEVRRSEWGSSGVRGGCRGVCDEPGGAERAE